MRYRRPPRPCRPRRGVAARYASTHGYTYHSEGIDQQTGVPAVSSAADLGPALAGQSSLLDPSLLQVNLSFTAPATVSPANVVSYMDANPNLDPPGQKVIQNYVVVTVTYQWFPEMYIAGPVTLTSTSSMPITN